MFFGCQSLTVLDLTSFNTQNVTYMSDMFNGCKSLKVLDLSSFNTKNVINMRFMFNACQSLTVLDLSSFNATKADIYEMFSGCSKLKKCECQDKKIKKSFAGCITY